MARRPAPPGRTAWIAVLGAATIAGGAVLAASPERADAADEADWISPPELFRIVEASEVTYVIRALDDLEDVEVDEIAERFWPRIGEAPEAPWVAVDADGRRSLEDYDLGEACLSALAEAEPLFADEKYDEALAGYRGAAERHPRCYLAHAHVGDAHYFQGEYAPALAAYDRAIALNPYDFRLHYYRGNALARLEEPDGARAAYVHALALRPHRESVIRTLRSKADELGIRVVDRPFAPRAFAREEGDGIGVYVDPDKPYWMAYGLCKAVWIGEPKVRIERNGDDEHSWTLTEERQCLLSMMENYYALRDEGKIDEDPELERLLRVMEGAGLDGFVLYEIGYRLFPHVTLLLPDDAFDHVKTYVDRHVVVDRVP